MKTTGFSIVLLGALSLILVLNSCAPPVPHSVEAQKECITCHGSNGAKPYPAWHAKRGYQNDDCSTCHHLKINDRHVADALTK